MADSSTNAYAGIVANPNGAKGRELLNAGLKAGTTLGVGQTLNNGVITPEKLAPVAPLKVPPILPQVGGSSSQENIKSITDNNKTQAEIDAKNKLDLLKTTSDTSLNDYITNILELGKAPAKESQLITDLGGDEAKKQADEYGSQIEAEQLATRHAIETLRKSNPEGLFAGALESRVNDIQNASLSKQADLAILQNTALKKFDTASAIASRKVEAETAGLKATLEARKAIYDANKSSFDKEEQRQIDAKIKAEDRAYNEEVDRKKQIANIQLEVAKIDPRLSLRVGQAKTYEDAINLSAPALAGSNNEFIKVGDNQMLVNKVTGKVVKNFGGGEGTGVSGANPNLTGLVSVAGLISGFPSVASQKAFNASIKDLASKGGNGRSVAEKIIGTALSNVQDTDTRKRVNGGFTIAQQLTRLDTLLAQYEAKGGKTGLLTGNIQKAKQKVGAVGNKDLANIGVQILNTLDTLARSRTGAVISPSEEKLYNRLLPNTTKSGELNSAVIDGLKQSLMADVENQLRFSITQDGLGLVRAQLPEVFSSSTKPDSFLESFNNKTGTSNLNNSDFFRGL